MRLTIQYKLFLVMLTSAIAVIGYMAVLIQWSFDKGFLEYVNTVEWEELHLLGSEIEKYYREYRSLQILQDDPLEIYRIYAVTLKNGERKESLLAHLKKQELPPWAPESRSDGDGKKGRFRHPMSRTVILDAQKNLLYGYIRDEALPELMSLRYQNSTIGYIGRYPPGLLTDNQQVLFVKRQRLVLLLITVAALFITLGLSFPLAYHFSKPIRRLSEAANRLISGDYKVRVHATARDEVGQLSRNFNRLAETLCENEAERKRWVDDIAHELRTPLNSLQGEIEAVQDGIRRANTDTFVRLHESVIRLSRLVDDLKVLSLTDRMEFSYHFEVVDLRACVVSELGGRAGDFEAAGLSLITDVVEGPVLVWGDRLRLQQLLANLVKNSIAYTDRGGDVRVCLRYGEGGTILTISDSKPGVPDECLPLLCDRLFRVEKSRNRNLGGAGLGLAICEGIVKAHKGTLQLSHATEGGLCVHILLPRAEG